MFETSHPDSRRVRNFNSVLASGVTDAMSLQEFSRFSELESGLYPAFESIRIHQEIHFNGAQKWDVHVVPVAITDPSDPEYAGWQTWGDSTLQYGLQFLVGDENTRLRDIPYANFWRYNWLGSFRYIELQEPKKYQYHGPISLGRERQPGDRVNIASIRAGSAVEGFEFPYGSITKRVFCHGSVWVDQNSVARFNAYVVDETGMVWRTSPTPIVRGTQGTCVTGFKEGWLYH